MNFKPNIYDSKTLNLTLSVLLKYDKDNLQNLCKTQDFLTKGLNYSTSPNNHSIYKYAKNSLHFSIMNFAKAETSRITFEKKYQKLIDAVLTETDKLLDVFRGLSFKIEETQHREGGSEISAPVVLINGDQGILLSKLVSLYELSTINDNKEKDQILKFYKDKNNFAINLVRVFRQLNSYESEMLDRRSGGIIERSHLKISRLSLVISDQYLSNNSPEIALFLL